MKTPTIEWASEPNVVILDGSEEYFKDQQIRYARSTMDDYRYILHWAGIDSDAAIANQLFEGSFIPVKKLIVIRDANKVAKKDMLVDYCESPNPDSVVVLVASTGRKPKWFTSLKCDEKAKCDKPKSWEIKDWLVEYCRGQGYTLQSSYADALQSNVGDDLYALTNELEKVFLTMREGRTTIGPSDITSVLVQHKPINPFNVLEAWCLQDSTQALRMASIYFHQSSDQYACLPLISMFLGQIEKMILFESYSKNEFKKNDVCSMMSISHYVYDKLQRQTMHWSLVDLRKAYIDMCEIESQTKRGSNGTLLINWFLSQDFS